MAPVVASALLWTVVVYRVAMLRGGRAARSLWISVASGAGAQTVDVEAVSAMLQQRIGAPAVVIIQALFVLSAAGWALNLFRALRGDPRRPYLLIALTAVAAATIIGSVLVHSPDLIPTSVEDRAAAASTSWAWVVFQAALWSYLAWALVGSVRFCVAYARLATGPLRTGLRLEALGAAVGLGFVAVNGAAVSAGLLGLWALIGAVDDSLRTALAALSLSLIGIGYGFEPAARWWEARCSLNRLFPLWSSIATALPHIALPSFGSVLNTQVRLYRRVMEIRDGLLALRAYAYPAVREQALAAARSRGLSPEDAHALAEAAWVAVALQAKAAGEAPSAAMTARAPLGGASFLEEVRWLERVAAALEGSLITQLVHDHQPSRSRGAEVA